MRNVKTAQNLMFQLQRIRSGAQAHLVAQHLQVLDLAIDLAIRQGNDCLPTLVDAIAAAQKYLSGAR